MYYAFILVNGFTSQLLRTISIQIYTWLHIVQLKIPVSFLFLCLLLYREKKLHIYLKIVV